MSSSTFNSKYDHDNDNEDFLEVDQPIPGQNYVCMSFISPEKIIKQKEIFFLKKFLHNLLSDSNLKNEIFNSNDISYNTVNDLVENFRITNDKIINKEFDELVDFRTNIRGIKIRGVYDNPKEARARAKRLQKIDPNFNVFIGQIGYWLPWDPINMDGIDEEYNEKQLNKLMHEYKINAENKDMFYEENKQKQMDKAKEENEKRKKENIEKGLLNKENIPKDISKEERDNFRNILDNKDSKFNELSSNSDNSQIIMKDDDPLGNTSGYSDPWMKRKVEGAENFDPSDDNIVVNHTSNDVTCDEQNTNLSKVIKEIF